MTVSLRIDELKQTDWDIAYFGHDKEESDTQQWEKIEGPMYFDGALNWFFNQNKDIKAYRSSINLGYQRPSKTDVHDLSSIDTMPVVKHLIGQLRKVKSTSLRLLR